MAIQSGIATGKARKSAGLYTFYNRLGVSMFRGKPVRSPNYKSSIPQRMQQSVFRFMKQNVDASGVKSFVDIFYDAKPRKGKSETKFNMFYRAFLPHLVAQKSIIYELPLDELISPLIFLGTPDTNRDKLTNGQLGVLSLDSASLDSITISEVALDQIIAKANTLISVNDTPYTANNLFLGFFGAAPEASQGYKVVQPRNVVPTLADGVYTFDVKALTEGITNASTVYVAMMVAGVDSSGSIDLARRKFATDSATLGTGPAPIPTATITAVVANGGNGCTITMSNQELASQGVTAAMLNNCTYGSASGAGDAFTASEATVASGNMTVHLTLVGESGDSWQLSSSKPDKFVDKTTKEVVLLLTNGITWTPVIE